MARLVSDDVWAVMTIWQEARGEAYAGKLAVAEVIRNRTRQRFQSAGSVASTVLARYQFSGWNTGEVNRIPAALLDDTAPAVAECRRAWAEAQAGSDTVHGAVFYLNPKLVPSLPAWASAAKRVARVGAHDFYTA